MTRVYIVLQIHCFRDYVHSVLSLLEVSLPGMVQHHGRMALACMGASSQGTHRRYDVRMTTLRRF